MQDSKKINPLIALAAISVTLFSLVGIAVMTGVMPSSFSKKSEAPLETATSKVQEPQTPAKSATASGESAQRYKRLRSPLQHPHRKSRPKRRRPPRRHRLPCARTAAW